jgi:hypothetical protein
MTLSSSSLPSSTIREQQILKWRIKADYMETCNCDYGCPYNFSGFTVDEKKSSFSIPGVMDVRVESFKNPRDWRGTRYENTADKRLHMEACISSKVKDHAY